jgi:hypothetical protein
MTRYLISFDSGAMDHIAEEEIPDVSEAAHAVVREAQAAGTWVFGAGLERQQASIVATDGTITDGPFRKTREVTGGSRSSTCPHARRRWRGRPRSPSRVAVRRRSVRSCPTRPSDR